MKANTKRRRSHISTSARHRVASGVPAASQNISAVPAGSNPSLKHAAGGNDDEKREEEERTAQINQAINQAPLSRNVARSYFVPWGDALPELVDYYLHNVSYMVTQCSHLCFNDVKC